MPSKNYSFDGFLLISTFFTIYIKNTKEKMCAICFVTTFYLFLHLKNSTLRFIQLLLNPNNQCNT